MRALRALASAFSYFTILPAGEAARPDAAALGFLPLVGIVTGALAGLGGFAAWRWLHLPWAFVVAWALGIVLTGAIHLDGFLDSCDALFASVSPERRLEIMRDPHHGTFAIVGMALVSVVWLAALARIAPAALPLAMAFAGGASRLAALANAWVFPYARADGHAAAFIAKPSIASAVLSFVAIEALAYASSPGMLWIAPAAVALALAGAWWANRRLGGGLTGDTYGALVVLAEAFCLAAAGAKGVF